MKRPPFTPADTRAADRARDLTLPAISSTNNGVPCAVCGLVVGVLANGRLRQHYPIYGQAMCRGSYVAGAPTLAAPRALSEDAPAA